MRFLNLTREKILKELYNLLFKLNTPWRVSNVAVETYDLKTIQFDRLVNRYRLTDTRIAGMKEEYTLLSVTAG
jgi:hypothetical protein